MATWQELVTLVQRELGDDLGVMHTTDAVLRHLKQAEQILSLSRALTEDTQDLVLLPGKADYLLSDYPAFSRIVIPLRVSINGKILRVAALTSIGRLQPNWFAEVSETPEAWFMIGATVLCVHPCPEEDMTAQVTFLRTPPTPVLTGTPTVALQWQGALAVFAECLGLIKEGQMKRAADRLKAFMEMAGIIDERLLKDLS